MNEPLVPLSASMETRLSGVITLSRDPEPGEAAPLFAKSPARLRQVVTEPVERWSSYSGYRIEKETVVFVFAPENRPEHDAAETPVRVAGPFNGWKPDASWTLKPSVERRRHRLTLRVPASRVFGENAGETPFKFISANGDWFQPSDAAPNRRTDHEGRENLILSPRRRGRHVLRFTLESSGPAGAPVTLIWDGASGAREIIASPRDALLELWTPRPLGVSANSAWAEFRLFAPRASRVSVELLSPAGGSRGVTPLLADEDGVWSAKVPGDWRGAGYRFFVGGENRDATTAFDETEPVVDPYAFALAAPEGPGLILPGEAIPYPKIKYTPPPVTDLVIVEAHLRDLLALDPAFAGHARPGYRELAAFIRRPDCPLRDLGVNALEFLPMQEFERAEDRAKPPGFAWGYMPVNWFAPASAYASDPARGSQVEEFADLVEACHEAGLAVILDVVYNHLGSPNALMRCDRRHFFTEAADGSLTNWSGCGNDYRADTPMGLRLIVDSLRRWVEVYGVDGFRFDLAELLGVPVLRELRRELAPLKKNLIFIAEPWSFRGYIASALRGNGYASWNDGFRDAFAEWVRGGRDAGVIAHFLCGSPGHFASSPAETINYTESHDDRCWLDRITENADNDGSLPTRADVARTRLMFACLFASCGAPMFAAGQEFLRTKRGVSNTYLRGDLSALTRERLARHGDTREFVAGWIALRRSALGKSFRRAGAAPAGWFHKTIGPDGRAFSLLFNAPGDDAGPPALFVANPGVNPAFVPCEPENFESYRLYADEREAGTSALSERGDGPRRVSGGVIIPAMSAAVWIRENF